MRKYYFKKFVVFTLLSMISYFTIDYFIAKPNYIRDMSDILPYAEREYSTLGQIATWFWYTSVFWWGAMAIYNWANFVRGSDSMASVPMSDPTPYKNINNVLLYREAKLGAMGPEDGATLMTETSILDMARRDGLMKNERNAIEFLEAKLGAMGPDNGLEYIKRNSKK